MIRILNQEDYCDGDQDAQEEGEQPDADLVCRLLLALLPLHGQDGLVQVHLQEAGVGASRRLLLSHLLCGVRCLDLDQLLLLVLHLLVGCGGHAGNCQEMELEEGVQSVLLH